MDVIVIILFYLIAALFTIKTISYGIFEWKQKNKLGGSLVIFVSVCTFVFFAIMMLLQ